NVTPATLRAASTAALLSQLASKLATSPDPGGAEALPLPQLVAFEVFQFVATFVLAPLFPTHHKLAAKAEVEKRSKKKEVRSKRKQFLNQQSAKRLFKPESVFCDP
ncbi:MAG: hypothetical protein HY584_00710, partial [Candidatus Omnitrophica bacterium]|nr:hypothetical protein [Candidatus Omnitrophota bacterium]